MKSPSPEMMVIRNSVAVGGKFTLKWTYINY